MVRSKITYLFKNYFEAAVFSTGLLLMAFMNPESTIGPDLCLFEQLGFSFCPGDGLGHSIAYTFRGDIYKALQANIIGPFSIIILGLRIGYLLKMNITNTNKINA